MEVQHPFYGLQCVFDRGLRIHLQQEGAVAGSLGSPRMLSGPRWIEHGHRAGLELGIEEGPGRVWGDAGSVGGPPIEQVKLLANGLFLCFSCLPRLVVGLFSFDQGSPLLWGVAFSKRLSSLLQRFQSHTFLVQEVSHGLGGRQVVD